MIKRQNTFGKYKASKERSIKQKEMAGSIDTQSVATRDAARPFGLGGVRGMYLNFAWLVSRTSFSDHYSFQCTKAMSFEYLFAVGTRKLIIRPVEQKELYFRQGYRTLSCAR